MLTPTELAASQMRGLSKCERCQRSEANWRGMRICSKGLSPKRCGIHYRPNKETIMQQIEGVFK